jgi:hypothetical protein
MIVAGARCDICGRVDTIPYTSDTAVEVMLMQKGWKFSGKKSICRVCAIKQNDSGSGNKKS